jgi:hypothetical protein
MKNVKDGDFLDDEAIDLEWVILKWSEKYALRMGGGRKWLRIVVNKVLSSRFSQFCETNISFIMSVCPSS